MDIGRAFTAPFRDREWPEKGIIAALLLLLPLLGYLIVFGWVLRYATAVLSGNDTELPPWNRWGQDFMLGLKATLVAIVWFAPVYAILFCGVFALLPELLNQRRLSLPSLGISLGALLCLVPLLTAIGSIVLPLPLTRLVVSGRFADALALRSTLNELGKAIRDLLVVWVVSFGYALGIAIAVQFGSQFAILLCFPGIAASILITSGAQVHWLLFTVHLWAQVRSRLGQSSASFTSQPLPG
uniref:DUF4013 domain-containing protein n=1 Tax=Thermomicrobium roseum TaxID=500 RepID=A0A7C5RTG0_THERO